MYELDRGRRAAIIILFAVSSALAGQQSSPGKVLIHVTDSTGADFFGARIDVDPMPIPGQPLPALIAPFYVDDFGNASFFLPPGDYRLLIGTNVSTFWRGILIVRAGSEQKIVARVMVTLERPMAVAEPDIWPEAVVLNESLPYHALQSLAIVGRKSKTHRRFF